MKTFESMLLLILILILAAFVNSAFGQPRFDPRPFRNASKETKMKGMRYGGVAVIGAGTTVLSLSINSIKKNRANRGLNESYLYREGQETSTIMQGFGVFLGAMWISGGTAMTIIANRKIKKLQGVSFKVATSEAGFVYSF